MSDIIIGTALVVGKRFNAKNRVLNLRILESLKGEEKVYWEVAVWGERAEQIEPQIIVHDRETGANGTIVKVVGYIEKVGTREYQDKQYADNKIHADRIVLLKNINEEEELF